MNNSYQFTESWPKFDISGVKTEALVSIIAAMIKFLEGLTSVFVSPLFFLKKYFFILK